MANPFYGYFGDVWKHLALAAILEGEQPRRYCDSHAGSAAYPALPARRRPWDYWHFIDHAPSLPVLAGSAYFALLRAELARGVDAARYPGSPLVALSVLGNTTDYRFVDIDPESLATIESAATELGVASERLTLVHGDGMADLTEESPEWDHETLVFVDPFEPFAKVAEGLSSVDLTIHLARGGIKTVYWYPLSPRRRDEREQVKQEFAAGLGGRLSSPCWLGEVPLEEDANLAGRLLGCGIMAANVSTSTLQRCAALGTALAAILPSAPFEMTNGC